MMRRSLAPSKSNGKSSFDIVSSSEKTENDLKISTMTDGNEAKCDKLIFTVVWAKLSTKKHKTWEGDGTIQLDGDCVVLKDTEGQILGQKSNVKRAQLVEGNRMHVGSKEIEIIEQLSGAKSEVVESSRPPLSECNKRTLPLLGLQKSKKRKTLFDVPNEISVTLTMPFPDNRHQWRYNENKLPMNDVELDSFLAKKLHPHQEIGVKFLYSCVTGIRNSDFRGAILADEMGLGKTLQCISLIWILLKSGPYGKVPLAQRVMIVTPSSLVSNWKREFKKWLGDERLIPYDITNKQKPSDFFLQNAKNSPVMIISYEMVVRHVDDFKNAKLDLIICDEGHRLKNNSITTSRVLEEIKCDRKIILTGTPVQNNLREFFALINFVNPGILGSEEDFRKKFENPIVAMQQPGCTDKVKNCGEVASQSLKDITSRFILRRMQNTIENYLPLKQEITLFCLPTIYQVKLYEAAINFWQNRVSETGNSVEHLSVVTALKKICNHPFLVKPVSERNSVDEFEEENLNEHMAEALKELDLESPAIEDSSKMIVVKSLLSGAKEKNKKVVVASYFTRCLDLLQALCSQCDLQYVRLDGSTSTANRQHIVDRFNSPHSNISVFLLSSKAGGVGLNLIGASYLILFDSDWNPASDLQVMARIWREGQKSNCYIYRLLTSGTIEEKIYQRQIRKTDLSDAVVDFPAANKNLSFSNKELKELFSFGDDYEGCLTHASLGCKCSGTGLPDTSANQNDQFYSDETLEKDSYCNSTCKMNQLMEWEHYSDPIDKGVLQELSLTDAADLISFIFRSKSKHILD